MAAAGSALDAAVWLLALAVLLPVQFVLLRSGGPASTADQVGVVLTILQWMLLGKALAPRAPSQ